MLVCSVTVKVEGPVEETQESAHVDTLVLSEDTQRKLSELSHLQQSCPDLKAMFTYLSEKILPEEENIDRHLTFESRHFDLLDGVLHHKSPHYPGRWCIAAPTALRSSLLEDAHSGLLAGHLAEKCVYDRLRRTY